MRPTIHITIFSATLVAAVNNHAQPIVTAQPTNQSVSLGASATFRVSATSTKPPILYQWRLAMTDLPTATNSSLTLSNIQATNAGDYQAVLTDGSGSITSQVAHLEVDPTFTKITAGRIVTDSGLWVGCAWGDYDGDGFLDLFVTSNPLNALYHNNTNGTFTRVTSVAPVSELGSWIFPAWADYDNDGHLDLLLTRGDKPGFPDQAILFRNNGDGRFTKMSGKLHGPPDPGGISPGAAWTDYDRDGFLDLYVTRTEGGSDWLLHNDGDGTFTRDLVAIPPDNQDAFGSTWADYNNDGWPDLCVGNLPNSLYQNDGNGAFTTVLTGSLVTQSFGNGWWADYDNDGYLDLLSADATNNPVLFHNNGNGIFAEQTNQQGGSIFSDVGGSWSAVNWGDYDNDGFVDLFITSHSAGPNFLYNNNGDGGFTRVLSGSPANDPGYGAGCVWGDYDNDGFLDLFVARNAFGAGQALTNLLYHNNGNSNAWIKFRLVGAASNRSAIGAKVRVKATIGGRSFWQMREINTGGDGNFSAALLEAHFGLGDATNIDLVRIEWPSGIVQTMTNVPPSQHLTVAEHQENPVGPFSFTGASISTSGAIHLTVTGDPGVLYVLEASTNLVNWTKVGVRTNATSSVEFFDSKATNFTRRYYRASAP